MSCQTDLLWVPVWYSAGFVSILLVPSLWTYYGCQFHNIHLCLFWLYRQHHAGPKVFDSELCLFWFYRQHAGPKLFDSELCLFWFYQCHCSGPIMGASFMIFTCACFDYTDDIMQDLKCLIVSCACFDVTGDITQDLKCLIVSCACFDVTGDITLDLPLPRLPQHAVQQRHSLWGAPPVHELLRPGPRLHAVVVHTVPGRLGLVQNSTASWQTEMLQVYLRWHLCISTCAILGQLCLAENQAATWQTKVFWVCARCGCVSLFMQLWMSLVLFKMWLSHDKQRCLKHIQGVAVHLLRAVVHQLFLF